MVIGKRNREEESGEFVKRKSAIYSFGSGISLDVQEDTEQMSGTGTVDFWRFGPGEVPTGPTYPHSLFEPSHQIVFQLSNEIRVLLEEVKELRSELRSRPIASSVLLSNLNTNSLSVQNPISIILEEYDEECLAIWPEVNAHGLGSTLNEAISDLKQNIENLFFNLSNRDEESLGELASETLNTLNSYIYKKE